MNLPINIGYKLILKTYRKINEEQIFDIWNTEHVYWNESEFKSLKEYTDDILGSNEPIKKKSSEEIINKAKKISDRFKNEYHNKKEV